MSIASNINDLIEVGWSSSLAKHRQWKLRVIAFLRASGLNEVAEEFQRVALQGSDWSEAEPALIGFLEGIVAARSDVPADAAMKLTQSGSQAMHSKRVFIVHGHDTEAKEMVARFLDRLGLEPIILHEQASSGQTVIEKFEAHSNVGFAVVLLTPDDVGALASDRANLHARARQNVILELGYFLGKLTRRRVCALYKKGVEIPSDYQGVVFVEFDNPGAWRTKLAQELVEANFSIKLDALLKS